MQNIIIKAEVGYEALENYYPRNHPFIGAVNSCIKNTGREEWRYDDT